MTVISRVLQELERGGEVTGQTIADLITEHKIPRNRMIGLFNRYKTDSTQEWYTVGKSSSIFRRVFDDSSKINNQVNVDHFSNICNTKTGYFVGEPITYTVSEGAKERILIETKIKEFLNRIDTVDLDTETGKMASICGLGARLYYINPEGKEDAMNVPPWECIFLSDEGSIITPKYAIRYYQTTEPDAAGRSQEIIKAEWFDETNVTYWTQTTAPPPAPGTQDPTTVQKVPTMPYNFTKTGEEPHMFAGMVPLVGYPNNEELQGDAEKVLALIDAYDRTISDQNSEIEQFRLAYLAMYGYTDIDEKFINQMKKTGVVGFADKDDRMEFITKTLDGTTVENHLNRLGQEIYAISGIPNMRDEAFSGNVSGVALKFKLFPMEVKCKMAENKFSAALHQQFRIVGTKWGVEGIQFDSDDLVFKFRRNFPLNLADEAQTATMLKGIISDETLLSTLTIVKDPKEEIQKIKAELAEQVDLDQELYLEDIQNGMQGEEQRQKTEEVTQE